MPVHSLHVFDRKGKTLFTKRYVKSNKDEEDPEELAEQRKLVFGMLYSLQDVVVSLTPEMPKERGLYSIRTGASTLYHHESASGLRFALYVTGDQGNNSSSNANSIRQALNHIYNELWIQCVTLSPLYQPSEPNVDATNFEQQLDSYLATHPWFR